MFRGWSVSEWRVGLWARLSHPNGVRGGGGGCCHILMRGWGLVSVVAARCVCVCMCARAPGAWYFRVHALRLGFRRQWSMLLGFQITL